MPLINLADQVREIPLEEVLYSEGFQGERQGKSIFFKSDAHAINVTGQKWYDHKNEKGGFGAIDLAMHLNQIEFRPACLLLADRFGSNQQANYSFPEAQKKNGSTQSFRSESFAEQKARLAVPAPDQWETAFGYLTQTRQIDPSLVKKLHREGLLSASHTKDLPMLVNATFGHRNPDGEAVGLSTRATIHKTGFKQCLGSKTFGWFSTGDLKTAQTIALTESPIDAMSLQTLFNKDPRFLSSEPHPKLVCVSVSGNSVPTNLAEWIVKNGKTPVLALDLDVAGSQGTGRATELFKSLGHKGEVSTLTPYEKDWNQELIQYKQQDWKQERAEILAIELKEKGIIQSTLPHEVTPCQWKREGRGSEFIEELVRHTDKTNEEIRQMMAPETLEIARRHKAGLLLDRAKIAGFNPSTESRERLLKADWKSLKAFEQNILNQTDPFPSLAEDKGVSQSLQFKNTSTPSTPSKGYKR
ncbi:MAG: toprim domain-containing protein [Verrucomicrobiota bacterium]